MFALNKKLILEHLFVSSWGIHMAKRGIQFLIYKPKKYPSIVTYIFKKIFPLFIPNLFNFLKIHHHIFLYLATFPSIHRFNRYPLLIFLSISRFIYLITIPHHLHLPLMSLFQNPHPINRHTILISFSIA